MVESANIESRISEAFGFAKRAEIAAKMEVNYQTFSNWVNGRTEFPVGELVKIAKLTDYSLNWILTGDGEKRTAKPTKPPAPSILNEDRLTDLIRTIVRDELAEKISDEVSRLIPADMILAPVIGRVGDVDSEKPLRKTN